MLITPVDRADERLALLPRRGTPVVMVDAHSPDHCSVFVDDVAGGDLAATHLHDGGHRHIAFVGGPPSLPQVADRLAGVRRAYAGSGVDVGDLVVLETAALDIAEGRRAGARLAGCPPAVVRRPRSAPTTCSRSACCRRRCGSGLRVPDDLAIVGYDDIVFAEAAAVPLTSVAQPRQLIGRTAAEMLIEEARVRGSGKCGPRAPPGGAHAGAGGARVESAPTVERGGLMKIALMVTCLADALFPEVGKATVALLERLGHEVVFPEAQTCCGQMHVNTGYQDEALPLVRHHVEVFEPYDVVVAPSGSCVGSVRHQHAMVARRAGDEALAERAEAVAAQTYELSELLVDVLGVEDVGAYYPHRVTYHPTCHSLRMLRVGDKPLRLLRHVRGMTLVELPDGRPVLRVRRHVRAEEPGHVHGDAGRQDAPRAVHRRGGADRRRRVVPDAHRRRAVAAALGHPHGAPGRDPA